MSAAKPHATLFSFGFSSSNAAKEPPRPAVGANVAKKHVVDLTKSPEHKKARSSVPSGVLLALVSMLILSVSIGLIYRPCRFKSCRPPMGKNDSLRCRGANHVVVSSAKNKFCVHTHVGNKDNPWLMQLGRKFWDSGMALAVPFVYEKVKSLEELIHNLKPARDNAKYDGNRK